MSDCALQINKQASPLVRMVGTEQIPVVTIDHFALDSDAVVEQAYRTAEFGDDPTSAYPGVRAALTRSHVVLVLQALLPLMRKVYSIPENLSVKPVNAVYSLVTTPESKLRVLQRLPHFDSIKQSYFAITHFLARGRFGGTGLYRHRPTGFETVTEDRINRYIKAGDAFLAEHGDPPQRYFGTGDSHYELIHRIRYRTNRLVIYPGCVLHSGLMDPQRDVGADPRTGRLTTNIFVELQRPRDSRR